MSLLVLQEWQSVKIAERAMVTEDESTQEAVFPVCHVILNDLRLEVSTRAENANVFLQSYPNKYKR